MGRSALIVLVIASVVVSLSMAASLDIIGCGSNTVPKKEGFRCALTCRDPNPFICTGAEADYRCDCKDGFVRAENEECVRLEDCPKRA